MSNLPDPLVLVSPEFLGGTPVFNGTRVPVQALFDYIEDGYPLDEFLHQFPVVAREHAIAVMRLSTEEFLARARAA